MTDYANNPNLARAYPASPPDYSGAGGDTLVAILWRRRWVLLAAVAAPVLCTLILLLLSTPTYRTTSRLYIERTEPKIISEQKGVMTQSRNYLNTQAELLRSRPILRAALEDHRLTDSSLLASHPNALAYLKGALSVSVGKKDDIISVSLTAGDPRQSALITNAVVNAYVKYHETRKRNTSLEILKLLQNEKSKTEKELTDKHRQMVEFSRANGTLSFENDQGNVVVQRLITLSNALTEAQLEMLNTRAIYEAVNQIMTDPAKIKQLAAQYDTGLYDAAIAEETQLRAKIAELSPRLTELLNQATPDHPTVRALQLKIANLQRQIAENNHRFAEAYRSSIVQQWVAAMRKEAELRQALQQQQEAALQLNTKAAEYTLLEAELHRTEKICDTLDNRIKEINVTEDAGALNISILEEAVAENAVRATHHKKTLVLTAAIALGFALLLVLALEWFDHRCHSAAEVSALTGADVLGTIPCMPRKEGIRRHGQKVILEPASIMAEAYRTIRTAIYFNAPKDEVKTILVSSPEPHDGKSTVVSNLAAAMAQAGERTLIVDADFRKPTQSVIFNRDKKHGLAGVLAQQTPAADVIQTTDIAGLDILPCESRVPHPAQLLRTERLNQFLAEVGPDYDRIIIDAPPILPVADARILAGQADAALLVVRAEKSTRAAVEQTRAALGAVQARLLGVVINAVPKGKDGYGYYGSAYYSAYGRKASEGEPVLTVAELPDTPNETSAPVSEETDSNQSGA